MSAVSRFSNGDPDAIRSKAWAVGLRNPFRLALHLDTGLPYVGDVGWNTAEEINAVPRGANLGWPCYSGGAVSRCDRNRDVCRRLYERGASAVPRPLIQHEHDEGASVTSGRSSTGPRFRPSRGALIYADFAFSWLRFIRVDGDGPLRGTSQLLGENTGLPVMFANGPDGNLYYLASTAARCGASTTAHSSRQAPTARGHRHLALLRAPPDRRSAHRRGGPPGGRGR